MTELGSASRFGLATDPGSASGLASGRVAGVPSQIAGLSDLDPTLAPVLLIALPIVAAAGALVAGLVRSRSGWAVAAAALVFEAGLAAWLATSVLGGDSPRLVHELGAYGRPGPEEFAVGIELVADGLSAPLVAVIAGVSLGVLGISRRAGPRGNAFYAAFLLLVAGLMGVALTGDVFNLFVFLEITGLATYTLVASDRSAESAVSALKYLIVGTTGASLYLVGVGYLFLATGTLNMADLASTLAGDTPLETVTDPLYGDPLVVAGFAFVTVGLFVKAAIFPLHTWQPGAYAEAPDAVTTLISALVSTMGAYAFARLALTVFTPAFFAEVPLAATAVVTLASGSVVAGSALAVLQSDVKRTFAYSSVSQFGLIVAAIGVAVHPFANPATGGAPPAARAALVGAVIHLVGHAVVKGGVFAAVAGLSIDAGARRVREYAELGRNSPVLAACVAVLGLTLVGVPPTVGFLGKWYIALGAIQAGLWPVAAVVLVSTLLTLAYVGRMLEQLYFTPAERAVDAGDVSGSGPAGGHAVAADGGGDDERTDARADERTDDLADERTDARPDERTDGRGEDRPETRHAERPIDPDTGRSGDPSVGASSETGVASTTGRVPLGLLAYAVLAVLLAIALGFAGDAFVEALDPFATEVLGQ